MKITGGTTVRSEHVAGIHVSLCIDYESDGFYRVQVSYGDDRFVSGLIDPIVAKLMLADNSDGFLDAAAEESNTVSLGDLFTKG